MKDNSICDGRRSSIGEISKSIVVGYMHNNSLSISPAGGSKEALIATPTKLEVESSTTDKATPSPLKKAIGL